MKYVRLGKTGLRVSRICLGCMSYGESKWHGWALGEEESRPFIKKALEAGVNFFDTSDSYSLGESERVVGRALKDFARREEIVLATKVFAPMGEKPNRMGLSKKYIMHAIDDSLQRLGMDYVDLYQIHRWDSRTPIEETLEALHDVVKAGKARYIGASSMYAWQFSKALYTAEKHGWTRFVSMQNHYNLIYREEEREMLPLCREQGIGVIPWSPLARGFLAGGRTAENRGETSRSQNDKSMHNMYFRDSDFTIANRVAELASQRSVSRMQIALAWMLHQQDVTAPIVGSTKLQHLDEAFAAIDIKLSPEELLFLEELYQPHPILGH
ncbi:MAG: aldo/keto reductase [Deltaproteobacteria bacterium]|nr:aldo/keto reductase [Deltaproteobacteria bacterium]